jgi:hypothetical protein
MFGVLVWFPDPSMHSRAFLIDQIKRVLTHYFGLGSIGINGDNKPLKSGFKTV